MIEKKDLEHGAYYGGRCRNAVEARWNAHREVFIHWRHKFAFTFLEEIRHPEDKTMYDVFIPEKLLENPGKEIPL